MREQVVDDVGPLALGDELARVIFRQAILDSVDDLAEPPGGAEPRELLRQAAALILGGGEGDATDKKLVRV
jgi:hypothetical protein